MTHMNLPEVGDRITLQAIRGEPSPYWDDLYSGKVIEVDDETITIVTDNGEEKSKEMGPSYSWKET